MKKDSDHVIPSPARKIGLSGTEHTEDLCGLRVESFLPEENTEAKGGT